MFLFELAQLRRKLKKSLDEIVDLGDEIDRNLSFLDVCGLDLAALQIGQRRRRAAIGHMHHVGAHSAVEHLA